MKSTFQLLDGRRVTRATAALGLLMGLLTASGLSAQTPEEHASHHPAPAGGAMPAAPGAAPAMGGMPPAGGAPAPGGMGGMMEGMGEMMKGMGAPPKKELYPELMSLPELTPEKRQQVEQQAGERMHAGTMLMGQALDTLNASTQTGNYAAMHEAMTRLREGAAQLESGIAARRALAEGRAPRAVALAWFKQEMSLVSPALIAGAHGDRGLSPLHLFTMALLVAFAAAMLAMYFLKMRRATALFGRIEPDKGSPPPGSAPELAGGKPPSGAKPPSEEKPPSGGKPPTGDKPPSTDKPASPDADPAASAEKPAADAPPKAP
jgi:hypothetical protein